MPISKQLKGFYNSLAQHGSGSAQIKISERKITLLIHIAMFDLFVIPPDWALTDYWNLAKIGLYLN
jgi:hypothetical protein